MDKRTFLFKFLEALVNKEENVLKELRKEMNQEIEIDETLKEIGDEVQLLNPHTLNYFIDVETDKQLSDGFEHLNKAIQELYCSKNMIVINNNIHKTYNCGHCDNEHIHDMIVYVPSVNRAYYCKAEDFKLTTKE